MDLDTDALNLCSEYCDIDHAFDTDNKFRDIKPLNSHHMHWSMLRFAQPRPRNNSWGAFAPRTSYAEYCVFQWSLWSWLGENSICLARPQKSSQSRILTILNIEMLITIFHSMSIICWFVRSRAICYSNWDSCLRVWWVLWLRCPRCWSVKSLTLYFSIYVKFSICASPNKSWVIQIHHIVAGSVLEFVFSMFILNQVSNPTTRLRGFGSWDPRSHRDWLLRAYGRWPGLLRTRECWHFIWAGGPR
jgi:hypothetical protein